MSETHLNANSRDTKMSGYTLYRADRKNGRDEGVANYVRNSIKYFPIELSYFVTLEVTEIILKLEEGRMTLVSCYLASDRNLQESDLSALRNCSQIVIAAKDFNSEHTDWGYWAANRNGTIFNGLLDLTDNTVLLTLKKPTHFPKRGLADILDIALFKNVRDTVSVKVVIELSSDHHSVLLLLRKHPKKTREKTFR